MGTNTSPPGSTDADAEPAVGGTEPSGEVDGLHYDPTADRPLRYEFWSEQLRALSHLNPTDDRWGALQAKYRELEEVWIDDPHPPDGWDIVGALGGFRSGKSTTGARWTITSALERPGSRWLAMGQDFAKAKKTTYKVLFQNLPGDMTHVLTRNHNGPETSPIVADYARRDKVLTLRNSSQIVLGSADNPGRHAGDEFHGGWLDEPSLYGDELHQTRRMIGSRLSAGPPAVQFWTYTGNGMEGNAAYEVMEKRVDEDDEPLNVNITVVRLNVLQNPFITQATKRKLLRQYEGTELEKQGLYGGYAAARGLVYSAFNRNDHVLPAAEADILVEDAFRVYGYDAGWGDPRVLLEAGRNAYGQLLVVDEFYEEETQPEHAIKWLRGGLPGTEESPTGRILAEHEPADIQKFRRAGYQAVPAEKSLDAGIPAVRRRLGTDSEDRVGLLISDRCENLIRELQDYQTDEVGKKSAEDHAADALRYLIMGYDEAGGSSSGGSSSVETA
jgi:hypothetical protein